MVSKIITALVLVTTHNNQLMMLTLRIIKFVILFYGSKRTYNSLW